jgi:hypothetical protein
LEEKESFEEVIAFFTPASRLGEKAERSLCLTLVAD